MEVPDDILGEAYTYGFSDTVIKDNLYTFIDDNKEYFDNLLNIN